VFISGLGVYQCFISKLTESLSPSTASSTTDNQSKTPYFIRLIHIILTLYLCQVGESVKPAQTSAIFYYTFTCLKFAVLAVLTLTVTTLFSRFKRIDVKLRPYSEKKNDWKIHNYGANDKVLVKNSQLWC